MSFLAYRSVFSVFSIFFSENFNEKCRFWWFFGGRVLKKSIFGRNFSILVFLVNIFSFKGKISMKNVDFGISLVFFGVRVRSLNEDFGRGFFLLVFFFCRFSVFFYVKISMKNVDFGLLVSFFSFFSENF